MYDAQPDRAVINIARNEEAIQRDRSKVAGKLKSSGSDSRIERSRGVAWGIGRATAAEAACHRLPLP
jgi:hypothetical protein